MKLLFTITIVASLFFCTCDYLNMAAKKWSDDMIQSSNPTQGREKSLSPEKCAIIYGRVLCDSSVCVPLVVAAFSMRYGTLEVVNTYQLNRAGYYSLYLPEGQYLLYAFADIDRDSTFRNTECVGAYKDSPMLTVQAPEAGGPIINDINITISYNDIQKVDMPFSRKVEPCEELIVSKEFPPGSIRSLKSSIFCPENGLLGLYNPPAFLERAGIYFYALEEHDWRRIPIIFVHGITGTCRDWEYIAERIDRKKFEPWFFYYPSGEDLDKLADIFYEIFLSGKIVNLRIGKLVICAHSMGGLVARAAINKYTRERKGNLLKMYLSLCTPYGGNDAAVAGVNKAPAVIPSWRDVATGSEFIEKLHQTTLPKHTQFHLFFTYRNDKKQSSSDNSDGTITLKSQLDPRVQFIADGVYGFNETHTSVLNSPEVAEKINEVLSDL